MTNRELATTIIAALDLDPPPLRSRSWTGRLSGSNDSDRVPSSCSFWRRAEQGVFYAPAEAHFNCPVGAMVMGFDLPQPVANELQQLVSQHVQLRIYLERRTRAHSSGAVQTKGNCLRPARRISNARRCRRLLAEPARRR